MGKRRPEPVSNIANAECRPPLIETEGIAGKTKVMSKNKFFPNTELGVDLKLLTHEPGRLDIGDRLRGSITHDGEGHFTFIENDWARKMNQVAQRNPHVYEGTYINVNRSKTEGTLYPTFNRPRLSEHFTFQDFCIGAANELRMVAGFIEEKGIGR